MKKYAMVMLGVMLAIGLSVSAQDGQRRQRSGNDNRPRQEMRMTAKERTEWMAKQLELSADQTAKVQALMEKQDALRVKQRETMKALREQGSTTDRDKNREEMRTLREKEVKEFDAELESIIGKEKMEKLNSIRGSHQGKPQANRQSKKTGTSKI